MTRDEFEVYMRTRGTAAPVCPHCGNIDTDPWELPIDGCEGDCEADCGSCGKPYFVQRKATITYDTSVVSPEDSP